jgi:phage shock protein A
VIGSPLSHVLQEISNLEQGIAQLNAQAMQAQTRGEALEQQVFSIDQAIAKIKSK